MQQPDSPDTNNTCTALHAAAQQPERLAWYLVLTTRAFPTASLLHAVVRQPDFKLQRLATKLACQLEAVVSKAD